VIVADIHQHSCSISRTAALAQRNARSWSAFLNAYGRVLQPYLRDTATGNAWPSAQGHAFPAESRAQPGTAADRFAHEIVPFLKAAPGALAAAECQAVGQPPFPKGCTIDNGFFHFLNRLARCSVFSDTGEQVNKLEVVDHDLAYPVSFSDRYGNRYEITTYAYRDVSDRLEKNQP
jgi:hypothetical protein